MNRKIFNNLDDSIVNELKNNFDCYNEFEIYTNFLNSIDLNSWVDVNVVDHGKDNIHYGLNTAVKFAQDVGNIINK